MVCLGHLVSVFSLSARSSGPDVLGITSRISLSSSNSIVFNSKFRWGMLEFLKRWTLKLPRKFWVRSLSSENKGVFSSCGSSSLSVGRKACPSWLFVTFEWIRSNVGTRGSPISILKSSFIQVSIRLVQNVCLVFLFDSMEPVMHLSTNGREPVVLRCSLA